MAEPRNASTNYSPKPWMQDVPVQVQRPNDSYEERMTGEALAASMSEPASEIRAQRPPLPQIRLFPPKYGYNQRALGIGDIVNLDDRYKQYDFSGEQSGYQGSSRLNAAPGL